MKQQPEAAKSREEENLFAGRRRREKGTKGVTEETAGYPMRPAFPVNGYWREKHPVLFLTRPW
ncbi:MAG: hypothetical protein ACLP05_03535 [Candidatus Kryptoniota bacterium]